MSTDGRHLSLVAPWRHDEERTLATTPIFALRQRRGTSSANPDTSGEFVYLDSADWVNVIALTERREVVLIEQFRHGAAEVTLEIPGGMVEAGEPPLGAGLRELLEETGYGGDDARLIGSVNPNPAIFNNSCHTVLVADARVIASPRLERFEEIAVRTVPLSRVRDLVQRGVIDHALVVAAFYHLDLVEAVAPPRTAR